MTREDELTVLGISYTVLFHSTPEELQEHTSYLPFPCVAKPTKALDRKSGTEEGQGFDDSFTGRVSCLLL